MGKRTKIQKAWGMYDWANSAYQLVIVSAIFPIYYNAIMPHEVPVLGWSLNSNTLYLFALSFAYVLVAALSPVLSSMADYRSNKLGFMKGFTFLGAIACMLLFFFTKEYKVIGIIGLILSTVGYKGSFVFYNAFLPEIAEKEDQNKLSAYGYTMGYLGSTLLLVFSLSMIMFPKVYGLESAGIASRITFVAVGVWWIGFAMIPFKHLKETPKNIAVSFGKLVTGSYKLLIHTAIEIKQHRNLSLYLTAYFFLIMGVQTVFYSATLFGKDELKLADDLLIITMLVIQFVGAIGAYMFARLGDRYGNFPILYIIAGIWTLVTVYAFFITTETEFLIASFFIGMVMGGIQSISRATYSMLLPKTKDHASFFSFYDVMESVAIVIGTFTFGFLTNLFGNMRDAILLIASFFIIGIIFLIFAHISNKRNIHDS